MINAALVTIHGFWSAPATWERLNEVWRADEELRGLRIHAFGYPSPRKPRLPFSVTRVPDYDDIAQTLATEYATVLGDASDIAVVTHSQGGLILQRFLAWMVSQGRARELVRIRSLVMLACPNGGSEYLESLRRTLGYGRHPQARSLQVLDRQVADTQRTVHQRIVNATAVDDYQCRIPFHVYAGGSDDIVKAASAQASFPGASTIAGNHFTILDPAAQGNRTAETVKRHILADIAAPCVQPSPVPTPEITGEPEPPAADERPDTTKYVVNAYGVRGLQIGDHNTQHNVFAEDYAEPPAEVMFRLLPGRLGPKAHVPPQAAAPPAAAAYRPLSDSWTHKADVDHDRLFGAEDILDRLGEALTNPSGDWLISIFGDGGAGKTTLAYEMVKRHALSAGFRQVAWASAKFSHLRALGNVEYTRHAAIGWHDLLRDIAGQLDLRIQQNPVQMEERLADALGATGPCVIVIDNLETVKEAELAMRFLTRPSVLRPNKVIITTRQSAQALASEVREFSWRGLPDDAVLAFARHLAADDPGFELTAQDGAELIAMSGGIPLLVKMAVRLAMHDARPVMEVIERVRDPSDVLGERVGLYLYEQAMDSLAASEGVGADAAVGLMNVFCGRPSGESFTMTDFFELSLISDRKAFDRARAAAHSLALIRGVDGNRRFTVHPLLREYVCNGASSLS